MDAKDVGGVSERGSRPRPEGQGASGRSRRRGGAVGVETLEGRTLLSTTINSIKALPDSMMVGPMVAAKDGNLWFSEQGHKGGPALGKLSASGRLTEVVLPASDAAYAIRGVAADVAGNVWYTLSGTPDSGPTGKIGKVAPDGSITEYAMPAGVRPGAATVSGNDLWVASTSPTGAAIQRVKADGTMTAFPIAGATQEPLWLTPGPDGNVWFTDVSKIGKITPAGAVTEYTLPAPQDGTAVDIWNAQLTPGSDGNIWFLGLGGVSKITPDGAVSTMPTPGGKLTSLSSASDGNLWIAFQPTAGTPLAGKSGTVIARLTTTGQTTILDDRVEGNVVRMTPDLNAGLWIDEAGTKLNRLNLVGVPSFEPPLVAPINKGMLTTDAGKTVAGRIATFQPMNPTAKGTDYKAVIDWGDGTVTGASITVNPQGGYDVNGTHTYSLAAVGTTQKANITITDPVTGASATIFALTQIAGPGSPWNQYPANTTGNGTATPPRNTPTNSTPTPSGTKTPGLPGTNTPTNTNTGGQTANGNGTGVDTNTGPTTRTIRGPRGRVFVVPIRTRQTPQVHRPVVPQRPALHPHAHQTPQRPVRPLRRQRP